MSDRRRTWVVFSGGGTGGHLQPALALAGALQEIRPDARAYFVGAQRGIEARILPERGLPHLLLAVEGFRRSGSGRVVLGANLQVLLRLVQGLGRLGALFSRLRPAMVVVTGGYAGGPAGLMALLMRIPLVLQEQNAAPGLVTRALSTGAREVHVAFPEVAQALPARVRSRVRVTGNPVRSPGPRPLGRADACRAFGLDPERPVVLVVGGSQGSRALNEAVTGMLARLRQRAPEEGPEEGPAPSRPVAGLPFQLLWSTGPAHLEAVRASIGSGPHGSDGPDLRVLGYIDDMEAALAAASLAVSRAGAMATSEFLARGLPSILVPLPTAAADHQSVNARSLEVAGAALCLPEAELDGERLLRLLQEVVPDRPRLDAMSAKAAARGRPDAARRIAESLARHLPPGGGPSGASPLDGGAG